MIFCTDVKGGTMETPIETIFYTIVSIALIAFFVIWFLFLVNRWDEIKKESEKKKQEKLRKEIREEIREEIEREKTGNVKVVETLGKEELIEPKKGKIKEKYVNAMWVVAISIFLFFILKSCLEETPFTP